MNKTAIKNFAIWARNKLIADIQYRAGLMGITAEGINSALPQSTKETEFYDIGTAEPYSITGEAIGQRRSLVIVIEQKAKETNYKTAYKYIIEGVAYTWFNRLIAVRFMEINDYLPSHIRVLSSDSGKMEPDLVTTPFDAELSFTDKEKEEIIRLKNDNELDEVFRRLFIKQCNALNELLPALFEKTADYTELLLNISAIDKEGVVYHLVNDISEDDFNIEKGGQVEIIGWLYQYYNTEPKNEAFAKNGKITKEEIPAVTQLFTPDWIVRYMVENSLGRLWVEGHPNELLQSKWKYYLEEAEQEPEVQAKLEEIHKEYAKLNPKDIHFIDPCMGSGHILVYAFDVLMQIYESAGYSQRDAARSILENNLYGLDIDDRAYQMAYFAVMMKARQYNRRILSADTPCHVYSIQDSNSINRNQLTYFGVGLSELEKNDAMNQITGLLDTFRDAKEYGSILNVENYNWDLLRKFVGGSDIEGQMTLDAVGLPQTQEKIKQLIDMSETMARKYEIVVTNPPYMGGGGMSSKLCDYLKRNYFNSKADLFAVFIERTSSFARKNSYVAMITQNSWMYLSTYEKLRREVIRKGIENAIHLGSHAFGNDVGTIVQTISFVMRNDYLSGYCSKYVRLVDYTNTTDKANNIHNMELTYSKNSELFLVIPNCPIAYWIDEEALRVFEKTNETVTKYALGEGKNVTTNNAKYILYIWEVDKNKIGSFDKKWLPCAMGGNYRKWYGNVVNVIDWSPEARHFYSKNQAGRIIKEKYWNMSGITWGKIGFDAPNFRILQADEMYQETAILQNRIEDTFYILALLNSSVAAFYLSFLSPTINFQLQDICSIPLLPSDDEKKLIIELSKENVKISKEDWDSQELSVGFQRNALVNQEYALIQDAYEAFCNQKREWQDMISKNERLIDETFVCQYRIANAMKGYNLELPKSIKQPELRSTVIALLSYIVGCIFGRYSLDKNGVVFAGGDWDDSYYETFIPDKDNIVPITDEEYFDDDIIGLLCAWLKKVYGRDNLEKNLDFIANALGSKGNTSREIIRNYFVNDFFKDHCQTYSVTGSGKRPIYWLFDSGKQNGFKALIYLHRYNADTIGNLRVDYLHRMQRVYESEIERMQDTIDHSTNSREVGASTKRKEKLLKQLKECRDYDEKIGHLALARIELDLDDGVKVNYRKLQTTIDGKFYEVLSDSKNIMIKEK